MDNKIVFVAHSYHKKTRSCDFIVDYLRKFYDVEVVYEEEWETQKKIDWKKFDDSYKAVVIWQMFPSDENFEKISNKNVVFFPMFDHVEKWHFRKWYECKNVKIVSFSLALHKKLQNLGFNSMYVQYFIEPDEFAPGNDDEVFFWQRVSKINIKILNKIFKNSSVKIHIHKTVDPGQSYVAPSQEDEKKFGITYSEWFENKEDLQELIKSKGIYVAPRYSEGIGMSFLEAMAQGKVVVANNKPTMNEYIQNGKTGFLCNYKCPKSLNLSNLKEVQQNTYAYAKAGYEKWLIERARIIDFINEPPSTNELKLWVKILLPILFIERKKIIKFKLGSNASLTIFGTKIV